MVFESKECINHIMDVVVLFSFICVNAVVVGLVSVTTKSENPRSNGVEILAIHQLLNLADLPTKHHSGIS